MQRHEVNQALLDLYPNPAYLEIGVDEGVTFHATRAARKVGVDPKFAFDVAAARANPANAHCEYNQVPSDAYFAGLGGTGKAFDLVFIDGLHTFDQTLRDLLNATAVIDEHGIIVVDDVIPSTYAASIPDIETWTRFYHSVPGTDGSWMGDVFRLVFFVNKFMPYFEYATVLENHGQMVMWRGRRSSPPQFPDKVEAVSRLEYADALLNPTVFNLLPFQTILGLIPPRR